ncbi:AtpZ/AtpI family protein [Commensalibacter papalotli (ex Botero et al. 2024)]|uniref:Ca2+/Mg2+ transporter (AtpZ) (PUBMED:12917488) n=1 Tax=Commensalibacter papalotli (ex Botero et al. 2024) TaxID=2972766 RepID=A0ABM9HSE8_9PROT|nr:AtpZ/AtpI family protein [Commensalibacter papalotli (ex Botero et al. 2024)]CAI3940556.1 FoF1-type ATP synthase AtpZ/Atp1/AtpQ subunit [Commensalibacter papalotli (ex Botero et al. 2024)]CAI3950462.1 FoF1-type ATP synthase AtpZ/Atp1/AtpQ subunit [Commensalibacter papalotli (ex Botero et al. 2024)]
MYGSDEEEGVSLEKDAKKKQLDSFDKKLQDFESRLNPSKKQDHSQLTGGDNDLWKFVLRSGVELFSAFLVGVMIGYGLDYWLLTRPLFIIIFSALGMGAGVLNVWRIVKPGDIRSE